MCLIHDFFAVKSRFKTYKHNNGFDTQDLTDSGILTLSRYFIYHPKSLSWTYIKCFPQKNQCFSLWKILFLIESLSSETQNFFYFIDFSSSFIYLLLYYNTVAFSPWMKSAVQIECIIIIIVYIIIQL